MPLRQGFKPLPLQNAINCVDETTSSEDFEDLAPSTMTKCAIVSMMMARRPEPVYQRISAHLVLSLPCVEAGLMDLEKSMASHPKVDSIASDTSTFLFWKQTATLTVSQRVSSIIYLLTRTCSDHAFLFLIQQFVLGRMNILSSTVSAISS